MSELLGLNFRDDRIDGAVVRRRMRRLRVRDTFTIPLDDAPEAALRAKLRELRVTTRRVHIGLPRRRVVAKLIDLPAVAGADLRRMVGFELERHLPFPVPDAIFDFSVVEQVPGRPVRCLLVALERRVFERIDTVAREAGLVPRLVDVAIHSLGALLASAAGDGHPGRIALHLAEKDAEFVVAWRGHPLLSRGFALPSDPTQRAALLVRELGRQLEYLPADTRAQITEIVVVGDRALLGSDLTEKWAELGSGLRLRATPGLPPGLSDLAVDDPEALPAVAVAARVPWRGPLRTNLMPESQRPRPFPWPLAATAALAGITVLLAAAIPVVSAVREERVLRDLTSRIDALAPRVKEVEGLMGAAARARQEVETLAQFEQEHVRALPVLRELTERLPADVWLTNMSLDRKQAELSGFAGAAAQLIPLLEGSPAFERVEFTSPVTKGKDRDQFRLRAFWERAPGPPAAASQQGPAGRAGQRAPEARGR